MQFDAEDEEAPFGTIADLGQTAAADRTVSRDAHDTAQPDADNETREDGSLDEVTAGVAAISAHDA